MDERRARQIGDYILMKSKISHIVLAVTLLIILSLTLTAFGPSSVAYAADGSNAVNFDNTDVLDDLKGSALNGVPFDVEDYPYDKNGEISVLGFVEYCYSEYENLRGNYGLYLYLYNPALKDISERSNRIQMATAYDADGEPTDYNKFDLQVVSVSKGVAANRFWKLKVVGAEYFLDKVDLTARNYFVSGIELWIYGENTPREYSVKTRYTYTGFADGYGSSGEPLLCDVQEFDAIELQVQHTSYLANVTSNGHYNQVHTAYFAVPDYYFENYGRLQKIFAEWYEYKLVPMLVSSDYGFYELVNQYSGYKLNGQYDDYVPFWMWYGLDTNEGWGVSHVRTTNEWVYNVADHAKFDPMGQWSDIRTSGIHCPMIPLAFYSEVTDPYEIFKFLNRFKTAGSVSSSEVLDKIYAYSNNLGNGYYEIPGKKLSKDLFYLNVDDGRWAGKQQREVDFDDTFDLHSYNDENHGWIEKLWEFGTRIPDFGESYENVRPIYELTESDLIGGDAAVAKHLLVNEYDVPDLKDYYDKAKKENKRVILFRFAVTDYMSRAIGYESIDGKYKVKEEKSNTYVCSETAFFNFDIIRLTFNDDGEYRAFAVVSDPIDIVGDLEPPAPPAWADDLEEAGQKIADFFKKIGDWFKENWKRVLVGIGVILALIAIAIFIVIIYKARGNKVTVEVRPESSTKRASRSYTKRVPSRTGRRKK